MMKMKKWFYLVWAIGLIFCQPTVQADLVGPYGTAPITFDVDANGLLSATGTYGGTGSLSLSGAGTRMFWYPQKAAFRAGYVSGSQWDDTNIGNYSTAFGENSKASGAISVAMGYNATANNTCAIALGPTTASGTYSVAVGEATATGNYASFAAGCSLASGSTATSMGQLTTASGDYSTAMGYGSTASGSTSTAAGYYTTAAAYDSFVVGTYNVGTGTATSWVSGDPLFEVGNGTSSSAKADALVVYKNGNANVQGTLAAHGTVRFNAGGDLSMGSFTAGTAP